MSLLERIKELREANGKISINRLEKEAGLTRGSMAKWDSHTPSYDKLKKVADYFDVSVSELTGEQKNTGLPKEAGWKQLAIDLLSQLTPDELDREIAYLQKRVNEKDN